MPAPLLPHTCSRSRSSSNISCFAVCSFLLVLHTVFDVAVAAAAAAGSCRLNCSNITIINIGQNGDVAMLLLPLNDFMCCSPCLLLLSAVV